MNSTFSRSSAPGVLIPVSAILAIAGLAVVDPVMGVSMLVLAGILTSVAAALGSKGVRLIALVLLAFIASVAVWRYPEARRFYESHRERALEQAAGGSEERGTDKGQEP